MSNEIWNVCEGCTEAITMIESVRFGGKCQSCYLGISKQMVKSGGAYYTLFSAISTSKAGKAVVELNIAFPEIGVIEVLIGVKQEGYSVVSITSPTVVSQTEYISAVIDELIGSCIDFEEVVEILRINSIG